MRERHVNVNATGLGPPDLPGDRRVSIFYAARRMREVSAVSRFLRSSDVRRGANGLWRRLLLVFTIAAFAQQSYLTQTHIHFPPTLAAQEGTTLGATGHGKAPSRDDPAHCLLCQEILLAGACLTPAAIVLLPPLLPAFRIALPTRELPFVAAASHDWHGRAPPRT